MNNLSLSFARTINASLNSLFDTPPRKSIKISRLLRSQARRWRALPTTVQVNQIFSAWRLGADEDNKFAPLIEKLESWSRVG